MNDLSDPALQANTQLPQTDNTQQSVSVSAGLGAKEHESTLSLGNEGLRDATGQETLLSPEVSSAGVKIHPTTVSIPPHVSKMGVKPAGNNVPVQTTTSVVLPLTDEQIAVGLHQSITNSVRWLAEWCVRQLKHVHIMVKSVHGKLVRVKEN